MFSSARNLARWPIMSSSSAAAAGGGGGGRQGGDKRSSSGDGEQRRKFAVAAIAGPRFRSAAAITSAFSARGGGNDEGGDDDASAGDVHNRRDVVLEGDERHDREEEQDDFDDPLVYRLRHQKRYVQEKQEQKQNKQPGGRRRPRSAIAARTSSSSSSSRLRERDPFDLGESLTSEEGNNSSRGGGAMYSSGDEIGSSIGGGGRGPRRLDGSLRISESRDHVDVTGWGAATPVRRRSSGDYNPDDDDDDDDDDDNGELVVGFGRRRRRRSTVSGTSPDGGDLLQVDFGGVTPPTAARRRRSTVGSSPGDADLLQVDFGEGTSATRRSMTRGSSAAAAPVHGGGGDDDDDDSEDNNFGYLPPNFRRDNNAKSPLDAMTTGEEEMSRVSSYSCLSHTDLEQILSSLEDEALISSERSAAKEDASLSERSAAKEEVSSSERSSETREAPVAHRQPPLSAMVTTQSCASSLSSPTEKFFRSVIPDGCPPLPESLHIRSSAVPTKDAPTQASEKTPQQGHDREGHHVDNPNQQQQQQQQQQQSAFVKPFLLPQRSSSLSVETPPRPDQNQQQQQQQQLASPKSYLLPQRSETPPRPPRPPQSQKRTIAAEEAEEDDPRLDELRQQTTEELRIELPKMQSRSKTNLESSWAETARLRLEDTKAEDELAAMRRKLATARSGAARMRRRRPSAAGSSCGSGRSGMSPGSAHHGNGGNLDPGRQRAGKQPRRRRTVSASGLDEDAQCDLRRTSSDASAVEFGKSKSPKTSASGGMSYGRRTSNGSSHGAGTINDMMYDGDYSYVDAEASLRGGSSRSRSRSGNFIVGLGQSFRNLVASGGSVSSRSIDVGFSYDDDSSSSGGEDELGQLDQDDNMRVLMELRSRSPSSLPRSIPVVESSRAPRHGNCNEDNDDDGVSDSYEDRLGARSGVFYPRPADDDYDNDDDSSVARIGVFYPRPAADDDDSSEGSLDMRIEIFYPRADDRSDYNNGKQAGDHNRESFSSLGGRSDMDDFDFDPLNESSDALIDGGPPPVAGRQQKMRNNSNTSANSKERAGRFVRRPSFMNLFEADDDGHIEDDDVLSPLKTQHPPRRPEQEKAKKATALKASLEKNEEEIKRLTASIRMQEEEMSTCEAGIVKANIERDKEDEQFAEEESQLRSDLEELEGMDLGIDSKIDEAKALEQVVRDRERSLQEIQTMVSKNVNVRNSFQKWGCSDKINQLEARVRQCQQEYDTSQENAIHQLSSALDKFDAMCIPTFQGRELDGGEEHSVSGRIIARFDVLTDREEELVQMLCDVGRLASCQASFELIKRNTEAMNYLQGKLGDLECNLRKHLAAIRMLIKKEGGDDGEGTHTTESSTASERLSLERMFVEAIITHLGSVKQNQGKPVLDALSGTVEFLRNWDPLLLPNFPPSSSESASATSTAAGPLSKSFSQVRLEKVVSTMLKAKAELTEVKLDVLNEQAKFQAKMSRAGIMGRPSDLRMSTFQTSVGNGSDQGLGEREERTKRDYKEDEEDQNNQISRQISGVETLLSKRELQMRKFDSFLGVTPKAREAQGVNVNNYRVLHEIFEADGMINEHLLDELEEQITAAAIILSEKEALMKEHSSKLGLMQAQAREETRANLKLSHEMETKIKDMLLNLFEEESFLCDV